MGNFSVPGGGLTALATPFNPDGSIDWFGFRKNILFQVSQKITGLLYVGTTGESPTLVPEDHCLVIRRGVEYAEGEVFTLSGGGSNSLEETLYYVEVISRIGCNGVLLVDPYYNGPSSLEIRENYYRPIAERFSELVIVPYIIPGRTGCALEPGDLAILNWKYPNICAVKEARGDFDKIRETRDLTQLDFGIFSGDDDKTWEMMVDLRIKAKGVISVVSNIVPGPVQQMCEEILVGDLEKADKIKQALDPLFGGVTVVQERQEKLVRTKDITIKDKFRNPLPLKTMMQGLGMPAGPCRPPLGKMTPQAVEVVRDVLKKVWKENPWVLKPIEEFYKVSISDRLADDEIWIELAYKGGN